MHFAFEYDKPRVVQALRFHFLSRPEIRLIIIAINVFAVVAGILFYLKKIRPEPFFLGSALWIAIMITYWFALPQMIYRKSTTFQHKFIVHINDSGLQIDAEIGHNSWPWESITHYVESPNFYHIYFNPTNFFLIPKYAMDSETLKSFVAILQQRVQKK